MTAHAHIANIRPDAVYKTGVIQPYPLDSDPTKIAQKTIHSFLQYVRPFGPRTRTEAQPEEVAMQAKRLATSMAAGNVPPPGTDSRMVHAAQMMMEGKSFVVKSAGRAAMVRARQLPSYYALRAQNPASAAASARRLNNRR